VKHVNPAARPMLSDQGRAMDARTLLDRSNWRDASRDQIGMGGIMGIGSGRPILGALMQLVKEKQLQTGLAAARVGPRISRNAQKTGQELQLMLQALIAGQSPTEPRE
jgi:hypothetical protein